MGKHTYRWSPAEYTEDTSTAIQLKTPWEATAVNTKHPALGIEINHDEEVRADHTELSNLKSKIHSLTKLIPGPPKPLPKPPPTLDVRSLKDRIRSNVHTEEDLLATMRTSIQNPFTRCYLSPPQTTLHAGYLERTSGLTYKVDSDLLGINQKDTDHINDKELKDLGSSMFDIGC